MAIGFVVYFLYSRTHSRMAKGRTRRHRRPDRRTVPRPRAPGLTGGAGPSREVA
ncbi:hypothetical protein ACFQV4_13940 [Streptomyces thermocarboxydus]